MEGLSCPVSINVSRQQAAQYSYSSLKHLRFGVDIKGDPADDVPDCVLESWWIIQYHEGVECVYEGHREIARNVVGRDIGPEREHIV